MLSLVMLVDTLLLVRIRFMIFWCLANVLVGWSLDRVVGDTPDTPRVAQIQKLSQDFLFRYSEQPCNVSRPSIQLPEQHREIKSFGGNLSRSRGHVVPMIPQKIQEYFSDDGHICHFFLLSNSFWARRYLGSKTLCILRGVPLHSPRSQM